MAISVETMSGPQGRIERVWTSVCTSPTGFMSLASVHVGFAFTRYVGETIVSFRGPETRATAMEVPGEAEFFGVELRLGAFLRPFRPATLANQQDVTLPVGRNGRFELLGCSWELPTPENVDVFVARLERAGLLAYDPVVDDLWRDPSGRLARRTSQERFRNAVGIPRRTALHIARARAAAVRLRAGASIAEVTHGEGYFDQAHLTRTTRQLLGFTPAELVRSDQLLDLDLVLEAPAA